MMKNQKIRFLRFLLLAVLSCQPLDAEGKLLEGPDVETASENYKTRFKGKSGKWFLQEQENHLLSLLEPWKGANILDIGGGHGQYTKRLAQCGYRVTVLGSSIEAGKQVRDLVASGQCRYLVGNLTDLPIADGSFDIVLSFRLLTHLQQWSTLISEATRVARRSVIIDFPVLCSFNASYPALFWLKRACEGDTTRTFRTFREKDVVEEFRKVSFFPTARRAQYFLPMVVHRLLNAPSLSMRVEKASRSLGLTSRFGSPVVLRVESEPETHADKPHQLG